MEADSLEDVAPEVVAWKTLSITHVEYPVGDKVFLAYLERGIYINI